jgi:hypothetical protein
MGRGIHHVGRISVSAGAPRDHERVVCKAIFCDVRHIAGAAAALHNSQIGSCHVVVFWSR